MSEHKIWYGVQFIKPPRRSKGTMRGVHLPVTVRVPKDWEVYVEVVARPPTGERRCNSRDSGGAQCVLPRKHKGRGHTCSLEKIK